ncbi:MAG: GyrI-like domain-containing protein [Asticcacaulis sp.]
MSKIDFKTEYKPLYSAPRDDFTLVEVPPLTYLMVDGKGDPNTAPAYTEAVEALYALSYTLKFMSRHAFGRDYVVGPLEGLWWAEDVAAFTARQKDTWSWTMMILQPEWIMPAHLAAAKAEVLMKTGLPGIERARLERLEEGLCAQTLHLGSYDDEGPVLRRLHEAWLPARGLAETGRHHEIYLSDPRRTVTEKLRTILRQPVRRL